jgi:hypothetical protein
MVPNPLPDHIGKWGATERKIECVYPGEKLEGCRKAGKCRDSPVSSHTTERELRFLRRSREILKGDSTSE